jgi:anhydro-N-acetylmuramic acid kinase
MAWKTMAAGTADGLDSKARLLVGGGGVRNGYFMELLANSLDTVVIESMDGAGVPADAAEAMAFSLMGRNTILGLPNQLPQCTGVAEARVLGVIHGGEWLDR